MEANKTLSIAIMSGKGGVGKTNLTLNLGHALYLRKRPTLLMDCDLGLANLDVLLGLAPEGNMQDVLFASASMRSVIHQVQPGFDVLPAASGVPELVDMNDDMRQILFDRLVPELTRYEYVLMDTGAGIGETVQAMAQMAALRIIVITPEPTSLTDSYALIKILFTRYGLRDFLIVVNQVENEKESRLTFSRLAMACQKFLNLNPEFLASVHSDKALVEAVLRQKPLLDCKPECQAAKDIQILADKIQKIHYGMRDWMQKNPVVHFLPKNEN